MSHIFIKQRIKSLTRLCPERYGQLQFITYYYNPTLIAKCVFFTISSSHNYCLFILLLFYKYESISTNAYSFCNIQNVNECACMISSDLFHSINSHHLLKDQ